MAKEGKDNLKADNKEENQSNQLQMQVSDNTESLNFPKSEKEEKPKVDNFPRETFPVNIQVNKPKTDEIKKIDSSFSDSIIFNNENVDPRGSFDYSSQFLNIQDNNYMSHTQYDPNQYKKKDIGYSLFDLNSRSIYNPGMSTMRFISEMDLRCDDHVTRFKEDIKADRYCSECRILCCDACVIDFHIEHINSAKTRVEEFFKKQKSEMEELRSKINSAIKHKTIFSEFNLTMEILEKNISTYFLSRQNYLENLKIKIDTLICEENDLCNKMKESLHVFYKDEALKRMDKPLKDLDSIHNRLQAFLRDWDSFSRSDKAKALKNNQFSEFQKEAEELYVTIRNTVSIFKNKSKIVEKNLNEILKSFSVNEKLNKIESDLDQIKEVIKSCMSQVNKINFEEIKLEELNLHSIKEEKCNLVKEPQKIIVEQLKSADPLTMKKNDSDEFSLIRDNKIDFPISNYEMKKIETMPFIPIKEEKNEEKLNPIYPDIEKIKSVEDYKNKNPIKENMLNSKPSNQIPGENTVNKDLNNNNSIKEIFKQQNKPYEVMIGIKPKSDDIVLYDTQRGFITVKLNKSFFQDQSNTFTTFPDNSRSVNLGFSLLITGGYLSKEKTKKCYLLVASKNDDYYNTSNIPYDISIMPYSNMIEARERHNLIYLPEINSVLAASGFFTQNTEVCDLNTATWKSYPKLNEMRANATIACVNKSYVWIFSGFRLNEAKQQGIYSNTCEMLDLKSIDKGWILFSFDDIKISIKLCAMGVINISNDSILICGGFDGNRYHSNVYKIDFNDGFNIQLLNAQLPGNMIFLHNNFIRLNESVYNYDLNMNSVSFNPVEMSFKVKEYY